MKKWKWEEPSWAGEKETVHRCIYPQIPFCIMAEKFPFSPRPITPPSIHAETNAQGKGNELVKWKGKACWDWRKSWKEERREDQERFPLPLPPYPLDEPVFGIGSRCVPVPPHLILSHFSFYHSLWHWREGGLLSAFAFSEGRGRGKSTLSSI